MVMATLAAWMPGGSEWVIILIVALLLFGRRLPEVGRSLGQGLVEFKKGLRGVSDEVDSVKKEVDQAGTNPDEPKPKVG